MFKWCNWAGLPTDANLFGFQLKRTTVDAYVNIHNPLTTRVLGCNNNILFAVAGKAIFYITCYASKSTQQDDSEPFQKVLKVLVGQVKRLHAAMERGEEVHTDFKVGLKRVLIGVLAHTGAHVIGAPIAAFILQEGSRFRTSHSYTLLPEEGVKSIILGRPAKLYSKLIG